MNMPAEKREAVTEMVAAHLPDGEDCMCSEYVLDVPWEQHLADALAPLLAGWLAEAWDEGYRLACGDHGCSRRSRDHGQSNANPYCADEATARSLRAALAADTAETTGGGA